MKKVMMSVALFSAIAAGYSMIGSDKSGVNVSDLTQANVEAFASDCCPNGCLTEPDTSCKCCGVQWGFMEKDWSNPNY